MSTLVQSIITFSQISMTKKTLNLSFSALVLIIHINIPSQETSVNSLYGEKADIKP